MPDVFMQHDEILDFGQILKPHGVRGAVRVAPLCDGVEHLLELASTGKALIRGGPQGRLEPSRKATPLAPPPGAEPRPIQIVSAQAHGTVALVLLEGCESMDDAEALRGALLCIRIEDAPQTADNEWYHHDLEGLEVVDRSLGSLGRVERVEENPAHPQLIIRPADGGAPFRIPFVNAFVGEVLPAEGTIRVDLPPLFIESQR